MYIVRLDYQNGLHKEYSYGDLGVATQAFDLACLARSKGASGELFDEAGRKASIDGGKLQSVELVDLQAETVSIIKVMMEVQEIQNRFGPQQRPRQREAERDDLPEYQPAIGSRTGGFSS